MLVNLIITGVGGQGNVLASQIFGRAAVKKGFQVTIGETFGLSQRGGSVMSHIRVSDEKQYGPLIPPNRADVIVGLEPLETIRIIADYGNEDTTLLINARPIHPLNVIAGDVRYPSPDWIRSVLEETANPLYWLDATPLAVELGGPIMLNMIMLGALCELPSSLLEKKDLEHVLTALFPESKLKANFKALEIGGKLIRDYEN
jgi:indolepyruvate ferredoxin oxidoreductase beta subunit